MLQEKAQDRERLLLKFIKIMKVTEPRPEPAPQPRPTPPALTAPRLSLQHLRKLNNFNSYLAILSALDSAPIRRLEWQKQTSEVSSGQEWRLGLGPCSASAQLCGRDSPPPPALVSHLQSLGPEGRVWCWDITSSCILRHRLCLGPSAPAPSFPRPVLLEGCSGRAALGIVNRQTCYWWVSSG